MFDSVVDAAAVAPESVAVPAAAALKAEKASAAISAPTRRTFVVRTFWIISVPVSLACMLAAIDTGANARAQSVSDSIRCRTQTKSCRVLTFVNTNFGLGIRRVCGPHRKLPGELAGEQLQEFPARGTLAKDVVRAVDHVNAAAVADRLDGGTALHS